MTPAYIRFVLHGSWKIAWIRRVLTSGNPSVCLVTFTAVALSRSYCTKTRPSVPAGSVRVFDAASMVNFPSP